MWSYEVESEHASITNDSSLHLDILSQALQETFGADKSMVSMENPLPSLEIVKDTSDGVVTSGRTIKGDPLKVQYMTVFVFPLIYCIVLKL
jgi:hypothetical protein